MVITTAAVPGRKAPLLVTTPMVERMAEGSVIVDMAADSGGNCELSVAGETVVHANARIVGMANPPAGMPTHASFLYSRNVQNLVAVVGKDGRLEPDWSDEVVAGTCVLRGGEVAHGPSAEVLGLPHRPVTSAPGTAPAPAPAADTAPAGAPEPPAPAAGGTSAP